MSRRAGWIIGAVVAVLMIAAASAWIWLATSAPPAARPTPSPAATTAAPAAERAQAALDDLLTACADSTASEPPEHCGIRIPWGTEFSTVSSIRYRVEKLPALVLDGDSFTASGGALIATVSGTGQDGAARTETYRTDDWAVRGDAKVTDSAVDLSVW